MGIFTTDKDELMTRWMTLYLNLLTLRSCIPSEQNHIDAMRDKLRLTNSYMMRFFDDIGANPGAEV